MITPSSITGKLATPIEEVMNTRGAPPLLTVAFEITPQTQSVNGDLTTEGMVTFMFSKYVQTLESNRTEEERNKTKALVLSALQEANDGFKFTLDLFAQCLRTRLNDIFYLKYWKAKHS